MQSNEIWADALDTYAEQCRQEQLAAWRADVEADLRDERDYYAAMVAAQLD